MTEPANVFANVRKHMDALRRSAHQPPAELKLTEAEFEQVRQTLETHPSELMQHRPGDPISTATYMLGTPIVIVDRPEDSTLWKPKQTRRFVMDPSVKPMPAELVEAFAKALEKPFLPPTARP